MRKMRKTCIGTNSYAYGHVAPSTFLEKYNPLTILFLPSSDWKMFSCYHADPGIRLNKKGPWQTFLLFLKFPDDPGNLNSAIPNWLVNIKVTF